MGRKESNQTKQTISNTCTFYTHRENLVLKEPLLLKERICSLWGAYSFLYEKLYIRIENNIKGPKTEKPPKLNYANMSVF